MRSKNKFFLDDNIDFKCNMGTAKTKYIFVLNKMKLQQQQQNQQQRIKQT